MSTNGKEYTFKFGAAIDRGYLTYEIQVRAHTKEEAQEEADAIMEDIWGDGGIAWESAWDFEDTEIIE